MTLYLVRKHSNEIETREYEKVTNYFAIHYNGRRDALRSDYGSLHKTREEAVTEKRKQLESDCKITQRRLNNCLLRLKEFNKKEAI